MSFDATAPTGQFPRPGGRVCSACGRTEAEPTARFCGTCGGALHTPAAYEGLAATATFPAPPPAVGATAPIARSSVVTYSVPYVGFAALTRVGGAVGAAFWLVPCLLFALAGSWLVHWLRTLLDAWVRLEIRVPVINVGLPLNFVDMLRLKGIHDFLIYWDDRLGIAFAALWLVPWTVAILAAALFALTIALVYNSFGRLAGGVEVNLVRSEK